MYTLPVIVSLCLFVQQSVAVTLNDFTPRQDNLKGDCETVYTSSINGCQGSDFTSSKCSTSCISGLESVGKSVKKSCSGQGESGTIIEAFLEGQGVSKLCPNAVSSAAASTTKSQTPTIGSSTLVLSSTSLSTTGIIVDTSSTSKSVSSYRTVTALSTATIQPVEQSAISTTSTVGTAFAFDSSTPASVAEAATETAASSSSKKAETTKSSEGGSPFDTSAAATQAASSISSLMLAALACVFLL